MARTRFAVVRATQNSHTPYYVPAGLGGFLPYFASYSAASLSANFGLQRKHCDSGRLCSLHQSPAFFNSAAIFALHCAHSSSGTPCSVHQPATVQASAAGAADWGASGPFVALRPQPPITRATITITESRPIRIHTIVSSSIRK